MSTLFVAPDGHDSPALWAENATNPHLPILVATKMPRQIRAAHTEFADILWRALTAVLAPSDEQLDVAGNSLYEAEAGCGDRVDWRELAPEVQALYTDQARAMLAGLRAWAEAGR